MQEEYTPIQWMLAICLKYLTIFVYIMVALVSESLFLFMISVLGLIQLDKVEYLDTDSDWKKLWIHLVIASTNFTIGVLSG